MAWGALVFEMELYWSGFRLSRGGDFRLWVEACLGWKRSTYKDVGGFGAWLKPAQVSAGWSLVADGRYRL